MNDVDKKPRSRWRPRFSILTALLLMTIAGMAIGLVQLWREVGPLRREVQQLRNEVGRLSIDDSSRIHAIEVRTELDRVWKWRVYIPEGQTVTLHSQWGNVPQTGVPDAENMLTLEPGEQWITLSAQYDEKEKHWTSKLSIPGSSVGSTIQPSEHWFDWTRTTSTADGVYNSTFVADPNEDTVVLKRFRIGQVDNSAELEKNKGPTAGFIVWLEYQ